MKKKAVVFIDGSNFYFKLKELSPKVTSKSTLLDFKFKEFAQWLVKPNRLVEVRYYIGAIKRERRNRKSEELYAGQQRLLRKLQFQGVAAILGQIIRHPDKTYSEWNSIYQFTNCYHEKGVDVRIAVEMIRLARLNQYDQAYLISSDTDLVPAIEEVQSFKKTVQYVGTPKGQSFGLSRTVDDVRLLRPEEIKEFL